MMLLVASLLMLSYVHGQITVTGTVIDGSEFGGGMPLPGANIVVKGTTVGTSTDFDGKYEIEVPNKEAIIVFTAVGLAKQEVTVGSRTVIDVEMKEDAIALEEAVAIGYGVQREEDLTIAATVLGGDDVADKPVLSVDQALQGKVAGVQVTANSGSPGSGMSVRIRGTGTIGTADPLYVIDGVPVGTSISLNPGDVESMSILKDASATAIYGSRGANGVVLITTKGGGKIKDGQSASNFEFDMFKGVATPWKQIDMADAQQYMEIYEVINDEPWYGIELMGGVDKNNPAEVAEYKRLLDSMNIGNGTNWQDEMFRSAKTEKYQLRYSAATSSSSFSMGGTYQNQEGILRGTDFNKVSAGTKSSHKYGKRLLIGQNSGITKSVRNMVDESNMYTGLLANTIFADPTIAARNDSTFNPTRTNTFNPLGMVEYLGRGSTDRQNDNSGEKTELGANINLWGELEIIKGLKLRSQYSYARWNNTTIQDIPAFNIKTGYQENPDNWLRKREDIGSNMNVNTTLTYTKNIYTADSSEIAHSFSLMGGVEAFDQATDVVINMVDSLPDDEYLHYFQSNPLRVTYGNQNFHTPETEGLLSQMGRLSYGYKSRYLITATIRRDGSSKFGDELKYGYFPSMSIGWKIHQEQFFKKQKFLQNVNALKVRFGWGIVGNQFISNYQYLALMQGGNNYVFGNTVTAGSVLQFPPNPFVQWEGQEQTNLGLDFAMYENKFLFTLDLFKKNTDKMLVKVPLPAIVGTPDVPISNAANLYNMGYEIATSYRKFEGKFHYSADLSFTQVKNEVTYLGTEDDNPIQGGQLSTVGNVYVCQTDIGYPIASFIGYKVEGIFQDWEEVNSGVQPGVQPGDYKFVDLNKDGKIDAKDVTVIGNPHPDFTFGINLSADYKGVDLAVGIQGSVGNDIYNAGNMLISNPENDGRNYRADVYDAIEAWHNDANGDGEVTADEIKGSDTRTRINEPASSNYNAPHSAFVEDGSYLRIKTITLGYTLPRTLTDKINVKKLRVYGQAYNVLTLTGYSGFDPEIGTNVQTNFAGPEFGVDRLSYPIAKSILFGLSLTF